jgi:hypothetical protein
VSNYESACEPLARIFGVLGRWGLSDESRTVVDTITRLASQELANGLVVLLGLRSYPAVLLLYSYGLGLLKGQRYSELNRLFASEVSNPQDRESSSFVHRLFLGAWDAGRENALWQMFWPDEKRHTPLSDHLHDVLSTWTQDFVYSPSEFTPLFEEFELLAAVAYISQIADLDTLRASSKTDQSGRDFVWAPPGRIGWDRSNREPIFRTYTNSEKSRMVLNAGFARGEEAYLKEVLANLQRFYARFFWR